MNTQTQQSSSKSINCAQHPTTESSTCFPTSTIQTPTIFESINGANDLDKLKIYKYKSVYGETVKCQVVAKEVKETTKNDRSQQELSKYGNVNKSASHSFLPGLGCALVGKFVFSNFFKGWGMEGFGF